MAMTSPGVVDRLRTPEGRKLFRYSMASVVSVIVSVICLVFFDGVLGWRAWISSTVATAIATVPSYELNRKWAWGKSGRGHLWREVLPFWVLAFIGWGFSTYCVHLMETIAVHHHLHHVVKTGSVAVVYVAAFGVLWVAKFLIFNKILFAHHAEDLPEALDGRTGLPS